MSAIPTGPHHRPTPHTHHSRPDAPHRFAILVGALSGIGLILRDLNDPFRGPFRITPATAQLYAIRRDIDGSE